MDEEINFAPEDESSSKARRLNPWVGIYVCVANAFYQEYGKKYGPVACKVIEGGPAARAGVLANDVLLQIDGVVLNTPDDFLNCLRSHSVGDIVSVLVRRNEEELIVMIEIGAERSPMESFADE